MVWDKKMIGKRIRELRIMLDKTSKELSAELNCSRQTLMLWETGRNLPYAEALFNLAQALHTTTDYLLGLENEKTLTINGLSNEEIAALYPLIELFLKEKKEAI